MTKPAPRRLLVLVCVTQPRISDTLDFVLSRFLFRCNIIDSPLGSCGKAKDVHHYFLMSNKTEMSQMNNLMKYLANNLYKFYLKRQLIFALKNVFSPSTHTRILGEKKICRFQLYLGYCLYMYMKFNYDIRLF